MPKRKSEVVGVKVTRFEPRLQPGTMIRDACLVVDSDGVAWWVDPQTQTVKRLET